MELTISHLKLTRKHFLAFLDGYKIKQLTSVPKGYNNDIFWNIAHCVVTQQLLCYLLSDNKMYLSDFWVDNYRKGTKPGDFRVEKSHVEEIKELLIKLPEQLETDYNRGLFTEYKSYETSFGVTLNSVEDAISFNNIHEGLHLGYIMAMRKAL